MNNEKITYTAPEATIDVLEEKDIVLISVLDKNENLDDKSQEFGTW